MQKKSDNINIEFLNIYGSRIYEKNNMMFRQQMSLIY